jgi:C_GCAxxG_C_C family probable redox protein
MNEMGLQEELLNAIEKEASDLEQKYRGCSRSSLSALQKHFSIGDEKTLKASTPLAAGVALKGEVCGALLGGLLAVGLVTASENLGDPKALGKSLAVGHKLYNRFVKEMGTANCLEIQRRRLGKPYHLADPKEYEDFQKAGGYTECSKVVGKAARLAAEFILELKKKTETKE